jgi:hypothetical protein
MLAHKSHFYSFSSVCLLQFMLNRFSERVCAVGNDEIKKISTVKCQGKEEFKHSIAKLHLRCVILVRLLAVQSSDLLT